jgi:hypothetical protein
MDARDEVPVMLRAIDQTEPSLDAEVSVLQ